MHIGIVGSGRMGVATPHRLAKLRKDLDGHAVDARGAKT
jgi:6-phosphogluconate dehydrogenase (decarboxylating)